VQPARAQQENARIAAAAAMHLDLHAAIVRLRRSAALIPVKGPRGRWGPMQG
jgi:hypothetical protein